MGYCPRCGENTPFGETSVTAPVKTPSRLRVPRASRIVDLGDPPEGSTVSYGGSRFHVRRTEGEYVLDLVD